jgi:hypothetical protein
MNLLKQGIEYSPAGLATLKGAKDKPEQLGKVMVGSMVMAGAYALAMHGRSTWALPTGKKEREQFYSAGRVPYSVLIGDNWVSYSKLGPLAYPIAMASALHYHQKDSAKALSDTDMEKAVKALSSSMEFMADQSYMQGIGDIVKTAQGDKGALSRLSTSVPTQLIPLVSLQRWVNTLIDPVYRETGKGISPEAIGSNLLNGIVGASQVLPEKVDSRRQPIKREMAVANAILPTRVASKKDMEEQIYKANIAAKQQKNKAKKQAEDMKQKMLRKMK